MIAMKILQDQILINQTNHKTTNIKHNFRFHLKKIVFRKQKTQTNSLNLKFNNSLHRDEFKKIMLFNIKRHTRQA